MKVSVILAALVFVLKIYDSVGFSPLQSSSISNRLCKQNTHHSPRGLSIMKAGKDDEIAALEDKIRRLKEEAEAEEKVGESSNIASDFEAPNADIDEPFGEMLSESWKVESEPSDEGGVVKNLITAVIILVLAIALSQVPVGQEGLDKYSTAKPSQSIDLG